MNGEEESGVRRGLKVAVFALLRRGKDELKGRDGLVNKSNRRAVAARPTELEVADADNESVGQGIQCGLRAQVQNEWRACPGLPK